MVRRYEDFTLLLAGAKESQDRDVQLLTFHVQVPSAAGLAAITEPIASRCDLEKVRHLASIDPGRRPALHDLLDAGEELGRALFPGSVLSTVRQALARLRSRGQGLRLRIFGDALQWITWEYAVLPPERGEATASDFLALMPDVSIVRDHACPLPDHLAEVRSPYRILGAVAHPKLAGQIDVAEERRLLNAALRSVRGVELHWLDDGKRPAPSSDLREAHMFHFAGHGAFELAPGGSQATRDVVLASAESRELDGRGVGVLIFDDGSGGEDRVSAGELGVLLRELGVRVAVLNACRSAQRDVATAWSSVAAALLHAGVASVVAMQHAILDKSAIAFAAALYRALAEGALLDEAAHRGRVAVFAGGDGVGWGTPVLYLPEKFDGAVFLTASSPAIEAPRSTERVDYGIERQRHGGFVGRVALLAWLDQLLVANFSGRWVLVTGGPGMGKSALLAAWLARCEAAGVVVPHHFIRRGQYDWDDPAKLVGSLVTQINERFPAQRAASVDVPQHPAMRLAATLMRVSANELIPRGEHLVVLIDGLDEYDPLAGAPAGDPLAAFLPHALPRGVSFLCSSRPREPPVAMLKARDGMLVHIDLDDPEYAADNDATVRAFWELAAGRLGLDGGFVDRAVVHARGNLLRAVNLREQQEIGRFAQRSAAGALHGPASPLVVEPPAGPAAVDVARLIDDNGTGVPDCGPEAISTRPRSMARRPGRYRRSMIAACAGVLAAAAAVVVLLPAPPRAPALTLAPTRTVEVRFSAAALDQHRPLGVMRAARDPSTEQIKLQELIDLERAGARNELVGVLAMNGDLASARRNARSLPVSAQSLVDRAALELLEIDHAAAPIPEAMQDAAAARALSLTADALRIAPGTPQAKWNQAVALRRLGLALTAAAAFDDIAVLHEAGWAQEAWANADSLRRGYQGEVDDWKQIAQDADRMVFGGPALTDRAVARAPSLARDKLYLAVATAATAARLDALAPLARALDQQFATTALGDLIAHVRASDLAARAPLAAELRDFLALHKPVEGIGELRARALKRGLTDVALASFLAVPENDTDEDDAASLDRLAAGHRDEWWHLIALSLRAYVAEFWRRDYPAVDAIAQLAEPLCRTVRTTRCARILVYAGGANSQMGRADLASEQLTAALHQARAAAAPEHELAALAALGQTIAIRVTDDVDASAIAGAYLDEVALRKPTCDIRLHRLDFAATSALQRHRYVQAAAARRAADALEQGECHDARLRFNGESARLQLVLSGRDSLDTLRGKLARLEAGHQPHQRLYLDYLGAAATLVEDRARGEAGLRRVITAADARPDATYARSIRANAFDALVESAAAAGSASTVLALLSERLGAPRFERCVVGVASWNRLVVAAFDASGTSALETREIPEGAVMSPPAEAVSPAMRARLANCPRIDVMAPGPYLGAPRLLGDDVAWVYHTGQAGRTGRTGAPPPRDPAHRREVVVSQVTPPESMHLPSLQAFAPGGGAELLSGARATPTGVLAAIRAANLVIVVAHGFTDASEPSAASLILSPDAQGDYLLTAAKVHSATLTGSPVVILAGCDAGRVQVSAEPWGLATSFLAAGARVVIAPTESIPDAGAGEVFRSLVDRIRGGADPVEAISVERRSHGSAAWLSSIVVFE